MAKRKKSKPRNYIKAAIAQNDPTRYRDRIVKPEKGKGRKDRPRNKKVDIRDVGVDLFSLAA